MTALVFCDFDGTIAEVDATALVWKGHIPLPERARMAAALTGGHWNTARYVGHGYRFIAAPPQDVLSRLHANLRLRPGWNAFLAGIERHGCRLHVLSNGLDFYVNEFMGHVASTSSLVSTYDGQYHVELPPGCKLLPGEEFKAHCVKRLIAEVKPSATIYIGSSLADHAPALLCDRVFALRNSPLAKTRRNRALPTLEFDSFAALAEAIAAASAATPKRRVRRIVSVAPPAEDERQIA